MLLNRLLRGFSKSEARQLEGFLHRMLENAHAFEAASKSAHVA